MIMLNKFIKIALSKAKKNSVDIPVCAVITKNNELIALKTNKREQNNDVSAHAEILALQEANKKLNNWRLDDCEMFVTLEPCPMCAWAIINARIKNLYFGSYDLKYGAFSCGLNLIKLANSKLSVFGGIEEEASNKLLDNYFKKLRS